MFIIITLNKKKQIEDLSLQIVWASVKTEALKECMKFLSYRLNIK